MFVAGHVGFGLALYGGARRALGYRETINLGWLACFALLPDIIDKPVGIIWWELGSRRLFSHSLLFAVLVLIACRLLWPRIASYAWLVPIHLVLDGMWRSRYTLYFPFRGLRFDRDPLSPHGFFEWLRQLFSLAFSQPWLVGDELLGLAVLVVYYFLTLRQNPSGGEPAC
ncbi:MAG: metal-dependent hydrolase [Pseudomonadota bacterium]